uniref:BTB domain-containing protein n=1 Tax=Panagrolaimus sp. PS1159 TaxID=55785 RepID=A0AC35GTD8_9BILA
MEVENIFYQMQLKRFEQFKSQNPENEDFDVIFQIDGKKLYANKYMLTSISETFKSMLSERWTTKDEPITLDGYRFEEFYQFLCFIYSGGCLITDENVFTMIDIAEYYMVEAFKDVCDEYLSNMEYDINNISTFMDCVNKYSLVKLRANLVEYVDNNFIDLLEAITLNAKKFELDYFFESERTPFREENLFEAIYNLAEKRVTEKRVIESASVKNAIKEELSDLLPKFDFIKMSHKFLLSFVVTKCGFLFPHEDLGEILVQNYNNEGKKTVKFLETGFLSDPSDDEEANMSQNNDEMSMEGCPRLRDYLDFDLLQSDDENEYENDEISMNGPFLDHILHDFERSVYAFGISNDSDA